MTYKMEVRCWSCSEVWMTDIAKDVERCPECETLVNTSVNSVNFRGRHRKVHTPRRYLAVDVRVNGVFK